MADRVYRVDAGRLGKAQRTPQGGLRLPATVAFSTITTYRQQDGSLRREWLPPEEAKKKAWLDSLDMAEVTHGHPPDRVTPANRRTYSVGHAIAGTSRFDEAENGNVTELAIQDDNEIASVERGDSAECSVGYDCKLDRKAGLTPDGREYDAIKRDLVANHIGLRENQWARSRDVSGRGAYLHTDGEAAYRLDGNDNQITRSRTMRFDGKDYDLGNPGDVARLEAAVEKRDAANALRAEADAKAKADAATLQARHDGLVTELAAEKAKGEALSARLDGIEVAATIETAKGFAPAADFSKATTVVAVKAAALRADPAKRFTLDGKDEDAAYIAAAFDIRCAEKGAAPRQDGLAALRIAGAPAPKGAQNDNVTRQDGRSAYERNRERLHSKWKNKTAAAAKVEG